MTRNIVASVGHIERAILLIRGQRVILDTDLARIYGVETKVLNQAVKRNARRFPADFVFRLSREEWAMHRCQFGAGSNRSQIVTGSQRHRDPRYRPRAFTEHGAIMAAAVLNSPRAVQMSIFVVRAFVRMRAALSGNRELLRTLAALERELKGRLGVHEATIVTILQRVLNILDPPPVPVPPKPPIGFHAKERGVVYGAPRLAVRR